MDLETKTQAALSVLQTALIELLKMLSITHKKSKSSSPEEALSEIFKANEEWLRSSSLIKYPPNAKKILDSNNRIKHKIPIDKFDVTLAHAVLTLTRGFVTHRIVIGVPCINGHGRCCTNCDHKCSKCRKKKCNKKCCNSGSMCNHDCQSQNCSMKSIQCKELFNICCQHCSLCYLCAAKSNSNCPYFKLNKAVGDVNALRNVLYHSSKEDFEDFEKGCGQFVGFESFMDWKSFSSNIKIMLNNLLTFMRDPKHFSTILMLPKEEKWKLKVDLNHALDDQITNVWCNLFAEKIVIQRESEKMMQNLEGSSSSGILLQRCLAYLSPLYGYAIKIKKNHGPMTNNTNSVDRICHLRNQALKFGVYHYNRISSYMSNTTTVSDYHSNVLLLDVCPSHQGIATVFRIEPNSCLFKVPINNVITNVRIKVLSDEDWDKHNDFESSPMYPGWVIVKRDFENEQECTFGFIADNEMIKSSNVKFEAGDSDHFIKLFGVGMICHANGSSSNTATILRNVHEEPLPSSESIKYKVHGAATPISVTEKKDAWFKLCETFFDRYYSEVKKEVIKVPINIFKNAEISKVVDVIVEWLSKPKNTSPGIVITNYDAMKHCDFLDYDMTQLKDKLGLSCQVHQNYNNRILIYTSRERVVINMRILNESSPALINEEMEMCCDDVKLLATVNMEKFSEMKIAVIGLVVVPDVDKRDVPDYMLCQSCLKHNLIVPRKHFSDVKSFRRWWKNKMSPSLDSITQNSDDVVSNLQDSKYQHIFSRIIAFMATECAHLPSMSSLSPMPSLSPDVKMQVKHIMLTMEQQNVLCSNDKKIMLIGSFGSGKSILGQLKIKKLRMQACQATHIFYLCLEIGSLFYHQMKEAMSCGNSDAEVQNTHAKVHVVSLAKLEEEYHLRPKFQISQILRSLLHKYRDAHVHFIFDEYDAENLDKGEALSIHEILEGDEFPNVRNSTVLVISQSLEKHRMYVKKDDATKRTTSIKHDKYQFDATGMKIYKLEKTMRTTQAINELVKICVAELTQKQLEFCHPASPYLKRKQTELKNGSKDNNQLTEPSPNDLDSVASLGEKDGSFYPTHGNVKEIKQEEREVQIEVSDIEEYTSSQRAVYDIDESCKLLYDIKNASSNEKTVTTFNFPGSHTLGHNISGCKPYLISLDLLSLVAILPISSEDEKSQCYSFSICLSSTLKELLKSTRGMTVLCCDPYAANVMEGAFHLLEEEYIRFTPSFDFNDAEKWEGELLDMHDRGGCALITDYVGFRGMEAERLILVVDESDTFLKHNIVECLGRCTNELIVIQYTPPNSNQLPDETLKHILLKWQRNSLVVNVHVKMCDCGSEDEVLCELEADKSNRSYGLHRGQWLDKSFELLGDFRNELSNFLDRSMVLPYFKRTVRDPYERSNSVETVVHNSPSTVGYSQIRDINTLDGFEFIDSGLDAENAGEIIGMSGSRIEVLRARFLVDLKIEENKIFVKGENHDQKKFIQWFRDHQNAKSIGRLNSPKLFELSIFSDYLVKAWKNPNLRWASIDFIPEKHFPRLIGKGGANLGRINREFGVTVIADRDIKQLLVRGDLNSKLKIRAYFHYFLSRQSNFILPQPEKKCFIVGLNLDDSVSMEQKRNCRTCCNHCEISIPQPTSSSQKWFQNVYGLEKNAKELVEKIKTNLSRNGNCVYDFMIHHGKCHHNIQPGLYQVSDMLNNPKTTFEIFRHESINFDNLINWPFLERVIRYDFRIFTPEPQMTVRYKIFLGVDEGHTSFITLKEAGIDNRKFLPFKVGPGYFCIEGKRVAVYDIIDPVSNISTRLRVEVYQRNPQSESNLEVHINSLTSFFEGITISNSSNELSLTDLPQGYLLCYMRRSERKSYKLATSTILRTSDEQITIRDGFHGQFQDKDVFLNSECARKENWEVDDVLRGLQEALLCSDTFLQCLLHT